MASFVIESVSRAFALRKLSSLDFRYEENDMKNTFYVSYFTVLLNVMTFPFLFSS